MRITTTHIRAMKRRRHKIAMLTAYDYPTARLLDQAGVPMLLVGDTLGMVVLGHQTTIPVTVDDVVYHAQAVARGAEHALIVADMPFMSYQLSETRALRAAKRLIQKGGAHAIKLEGGTPVAGLVARMVACGIPVMGHIGLTPQSIHQLGGIRMQGKTPEAAARLVDDAIALEAAGAFALVLETIPDDLAREITTRLSIPTIGIGAGPYCDGQVQVFHDMIGLTVDRVPAHARTYANLGETIRDAAKRYVADVEARPEVFGRPIPAVGTEHEQVALESTIEQPVGMLEQ